MRESAFHIPFENASRPSGAWKLLANYPQYLNSSFWLFHNCAKPLQCSFKALYVLPGKVVKLGM